MDLWCGSVLLFCSFALVVLLLVCGFVGCLCGSVGGGVVVLCWCWEVREVHFVVLKVL